jgi:hypothetical protein
MGVYDVMHNCRAMRRLSTTDNAEYTAAQAGFADFHFLVQTDSPGDSVQLSPTSYVQTKSVEVPYYNWNQWFLRTHPKGYAVRTSENRKGELARPLFDPHCEGLTSGRRFGSTDQAVQLPL